MKTIGVIPLYDDEKDSYWMVPGYMQMLEELGCAPLMLPLTQDETLLEYFLGLCDGFLFTGGHDVAPSVYGQEAKETCGISCGRRDGMEEYLLRACRERDIPALGICRGIQLMNAVFGGNLYQDLPTEYDSTVEHHMAPPYNRSAHQVQVVEGSWLEEVLGARQVGVNSYHHQAVKEAAPGFEVLAYSEDGLVEAIRLSDRRFMVGVQWHPEFYYTEDIYCQRLVKAFVEAL